jgi:predicted glycosyltransferase involved in capsule biosynthesis
MKLLDKVIVADFSPPAFIPEEQRERNAEKPVTKHISISGHRYFNKSIALNIGFQFTSAELVAVCDADVLLDETFFSEAVTLFEQRRTTKLALTPEYVKESSDGKVRPAPGICLLHKTTFLELDGYCSAYRGWGLEDRDFLSRLALAGVEVREVSWGTHLSHDNEERTKNYYSTSLAEMRQKNWELFCSRAENAVLTGTLTADIAFNKFYELS